MTLAGFVAARLGEDEAAAGRIAAMIERQNAGGWVSSSTPPVPGNSVTISTAWMPARVMRDAAAKRAILAEYEADHGLAYGPEYYAGLEVAVRNLAAVWSDHPGYRQEWAPA
jgi:hypothetical protein